MKTVYRKSSGEQVVLMLALFFAALLVFGLASLASAKGVKTDLVKAAEVQSGTYNLITAGSPAPIAILQRADAPYEFKLATAGSDYKVTSGLTEKEALKKANEALQKDAAVQKTEVTEIKGPEGNVIGYQVTPVFIPLRYGSFPDITGASYKVEGKKIWAYVSPDQLIRTQRMGAG